MIFNCNYSMKSNRFLSFLGTPTPRQNFKTNLKADKKQTNRFSGTNKSIGLSSKEKKGKNCRELPKQNCQRLRVNPKPVWKNMTRKICRVPRTLADKQLVQQVLENIDDI